MTLVKCKECEEKISNKAKACPKCGIETPKKTSRLTWLIFLLIIAFIYGVAQTSDRKNTNAENTNAENTNEKLEEYDKCEYLNKGTPVNLYISEQWLSEKSECLTPEHKKKIENELYALVKSIPAMQVANNQKYYKYLTILNPENLLYKRKFERYDVKLKKEDKERKIRIAKVDKNFELKEAKASRELELSKHRKEIIGKQFSSWDGAHRNLERLIKKNMNDPDSYEHDSTVYWDKGGYLIIKTTYRGKNSFGGVVRESIKAKAAIDGRIIEIIK